MLNENLAKVRKERGLTQEALAIKLNVVRQTISKWEKGTAVPDADMLCRIADALDVPVATLLGNTEQEEQLDISSITKSLAQINEQLAVRNRHSANVWKVLCLLCAVALIGAGFILGKEIIKTNREINNETSEFKLPDIIKVSDTRFIFEDEELICTFVPSVGNKGITYNVTLRCTDYDDEPEVTETAKYKNGICSVTFDKSKLHVGFRYSVVMNIEYHGEVRNVVLAENLYFESDNSSGWTYPEG